MNRVIDDAFQKMNSVYHLLPETYFEGKGPSNYLFNNITRAIESADDLEGSVHAVLKEELAGDQSIALYAGVPWCQKICSFCNFAYSTSSANEVHESYLALLSEELELLSECADGKLKVASIYFGGGTPTLLDPALLKRHIESVTSRVAITRDTSVTCEFSTGTITSEKLEVLCQAGVTRVSTGVQSLDDQIRKQANLVGSGVDAMRALELTQSFFKNFNIDLIYGHPHQTMADWYQTVSDIVSLRVPSITLYRLEVKERTTLKKIYIREADSFVDERDARHQYFIARSILEDAGYVESPLGWWIQKDTLGTEKAWSSHLTTWKKATPYLGIGQGAFSLASGVYYDNFSKHDPWSDAIKGRTLPIASAKRLPAHLTDLNQLMRLIRVAKSFVLRDLVDNSNLKAFDTFLSAFFAKQASMGLFDIVNGRYRITEAGESLIHWILDDLTRGISSPLHESHQRVA